MKKSTPMQAYAAKRNKALKKSAPVKATAPAMVGAMTGREMHDPQYDLDTLTRAEAIKKDSKRHAAAMNEAKKKQAMLKDVMGKA